MSTLLIFLCAFSNHAGAFIFPISSPERMRQSTPYNCDRNLGNLYPSPLLHLSQPGGNFFDELSNEDKDPFESGPKSGGPKIDRSALEETEFEAFIPKINSVTLVGRIGQDPEPRYFDDGKVVLRLSLAVKRKYHPLERAARNIAYGDEETDWFNLELWGRDAEYAGRYVTKGARVGITGSLNVDTWSDKATGEPRKSTKIIVKHLDILESRAEAELRQGNRGTYQNYNRNNDDEGDDNGDGPSSAGSGGFFN